MIRAGHWFFAAALALVGAAQAEVRIVLPDGASRMEQLAARELHRYLYLRTGHLVPIGGPSADADQILLARKGQDPLAENLSPQQYRLKTLTENDHRKLLVLGGDDAAVLYAAYRLAGHLGVGFGLDGDVIPDQRIELALPTLDETAQPLFELRGIQPFHDFPEGPDWWTLDDYKAVISQLPKLGMNFIGLHTYPEGGVGPEPAVWIGRPQDLAPNGQVLASYRSSWANSRRGMWGYAPKNTSDYAFGASLLFNTDAFGPPAMAGMIPLPANDAQSNALFNQTGQLLSGAFTHAHDLGVRTCIGTETPLIVPTPVRQRLHGGNASIPVTAAERKLLYEGIFRRIQQTYPIDYYWLWTPEDWTWKGANDAQIQETMEDLKLAGEAAKAADARFQLATCGWVLGPQSNRALFDQSLPKSWPLSCINRAVGKDPVEPGFEKVAGRPKWAIPWMEDDPNLCSPQLWAGRMRRDAADARHYGCTGLMGIHWRTRILGPNVAALAQAGWTQEGWTAAATRPANARHAPTGDFYRVWAAQQFGPQASPQIAALFETLDGRLPEPTKWTNGPGGIAPDPKPWEDAPRTYAFVDQLAALRPRIQGAGNLERFDYWLESFRYMRAVEKVKFVWAAYDASLKKLASLPDAKAKSSLAEDETLPLRRQLIAATAEVYSHLLATVFTRGELGTVCNWEQHNLPPLLDASAAPLAEALGHPLPADARPPVAWAGPTRLIVPTVRTSLNADEPLDLEVIVLSATPTPPPLLRWRPLGKGAFQEQPFQPVARRVYRVRLAGFDPSVVAIEYAIDLSQPGSRTTHFPVTAPELCQTVVIAP